MSETEELFWFLKNPVVIKLIKCKSFEPRLFTIFAFNKTGVERWLGEIPFEDFSSAYSDLCCLLNSARNVLPTPIDSGKLSAEDCLAIENDDYSILKNFFENHENALSDIPLKSGFNEFQFYVLIALKEVADTYHFIAASNKFGDDARGCGEAMVLALSSSLAAQRILSDVQREVYFRTAIERIDFMSEDIKAAKRPQRKGGEWTPFIEVRPQFISSAKDKWLEQEKNGEDVFRKTEMVKYLLSLLESKCPLTDTAPARHQLPGSDAVWEWILESGIYIPKDARKRGRKKGRKTGLTS